MYIEPLRQHIHIIVERTTIQRECTDQHNIYLSRFKIHEIRIYFLSHNISVDICPWIIYAFIDIKRQQEYELYIQCQ